MWAILDESMPQAISRYFLSEPDYLLVYSMPSQIYYNVWGVVSSAMDVSEALSYSYEDHFYVIDSDEEPLIERDSDVFLFRTH